jgi:hypothetical protein
MKKELDVKKLWEVKPGCKVITIPKHIHEDYTIHKIVVHYNGQGGVDHS